MRAAIIEWTAWVALAALMLAVWPLQVLVIDSGRDLAWALSIARAAELPLYGPELNGIWHLGPAWYFVLAGVLAVTGSITGIALGVGLLSTAKLGFAYLLGRELGDRSLGIAAAALAALPGWSSLASIVLSHTSVVETAVAATLWLSVRAWRRVDPTAAVGAAGCAALALHAHPTAIIVLPAVLAALWHASVRQRRVSRCLLAGMVFVLPFLPPIAAEAMAGWPQLAASRDYFAQSPLIGRIAAWPGLAYGLTLGQAEWVRHYLLRDTWPGLLWQIGYLLGCGAVAAGLLRGLAKPGPARWLLPYTLLAIAFIGLLRDTTPAWMLFALAPLSALLGALGLLALTPAPHARTLAHALLTIAVLTNAAVLSQRWAIARDGLGPPAPIDLGNVAQRRPTGVASFWLPAYAHDALSRRLCARPATALHGDLATAYHFGQGVAAALGCPDIGTIQLAGQDAQRHLLGIPAAIWPRLSATAAAPRWGFVILDRVQVIHPMQPTLPAPHTRYLRNDYVERMQQGMRRVELEAACTYGQLLVVSNLVPLLNGMTHHVRRGARALAPTARTLASDYYICDADTPAHRIEIDAVDPNAVMVVVAEPAPVSDIDRRAAR